MSNPSQDRRYGTASVESPLVTDDMLESQIASRSGMDAKLVRQRGFGLLPDDMLGYGEDVMHRLDVTRILEGFYDELNRASLDPSF